MKKEMQLKARELRENGSSMGKIAKELKVSKSSVSLWVKDIELTKNQKLCLLNNQFVNFRSENFRKNFHISEKFRRLRLSYQKEGREFAKKLNIEHTMMCMLYWGEGNKKRNGVGFTNTEPQMMKLFFNCLKKFFNINIGKVKIRINCYLDKGITQEDIENYWLGILELTREKNLSKTTINEPKPDNVKTHKKLLYGTCALVLYDVKIIQHIYGAIQEYAKIDMPQWLF